ncbi:polymorphic toxin-type HINT domain-containing protein [Streptacidiphilus sp. N1-12]|uniref:Polymorphic toxin-type HINT domain-containing protein n=2 Tax=Streptacidiphilus alkalitolerans TaxID=3342712 RepID=A0ABV6VCW7_9ACTN
MMKQEGDYYPDLSYSYNVELFFRAKCAGSEVDCDLIDRFYHNYKDVHGIPDNPCALTSLCQDLPALLAVAGIDGETGVGGACSFAPTTPVLLANGKAKPIGDLKVGDKVEAADPSTGKEEGGRAVQHVWINHDNDLLDIGVSTGGGHTSIIHTTANHPFWDDTTHGWVAAGDLKPGHALASTQGRHPTVRTVRSTPGVANRYNLTVRQLHTYYILAGNVPVLVHNTGSCILTDEEGLASANSASSQFDKPGNMSGALYLEGHDDPIALSSGRGNVGDDYARPPGSGDFYHHLEAQAAAQMRKTGVMDGQLFISGDYVCGACSDNLSKMLPPGATLRVTFQKSDGSIQTIPYTGAG